MVLSTWESLVSMISLRRDTLFSRDEIPVYPFYRSFVDVRSDSHVHAPLLHLAERGVERRVGRTILVDDHPGEEEIDLPVVPQIPEFLLIVFQEDEIDHLTEIL